MKKRNILLAALGVAIGLVTAMAGTPSETGLAIMHAKGSDVIKVVYKPEDQGTVKLNVYKEGSELIYSEVLKATEGFMRPLNFSGLESGEYTIELIDKKGIKTEKISYKESAIKFVHVKKVAHEEGKYLLTAISETDLALGVINVRIFDGDHLIYDGGKNFTGEYAELYQVQDIKGLLTFQVIDEHGTIVERSF